MQIQRVNPQQDQSFGTAVTIKTANDKIARKLLKLGELFSEQNHPEFRFLFTGIEGNSDMFKGILGDKDHKEVIAGVQKLSLGNRLRQKVVKAICEAVKEEGDKPIVIESMEEILDLPIVANCRDSIAKIIASIKAD